MAGSDSFAVTDHEAQSKAATFKDADPFPDIPCSLLNSADISDYVRKTGMIHPFNLGKMKPASYEAKISGEVYIYEAGNSEHPLVINGNEEWTLPQNSIAYVNVEPYFRLPNYIALRFNLCVKHVHRGLLLGTGPLIDPGFTGKILIPLHNLTNNDYKIEPNADLIAVEFTKTSPYSSWVSDENYTRHPEQLGEYKVWDKSPSDRPFIFLGKALLDQDMNKITSSMSGVLTKLKEMKKKAADDTLDAKDKINESKEIAENAEASAEKAQSALSRIGVVASIITFITLVAMLISIWALISDTRAELLSKILTTEEKVTSFKAVNENKIKAMEKEIARLKVRNNQLNANVNIDGKIQLSKETIDSQNKEVDASLDNEQDLK